MYPTEYKPLSALYPNPDNPRFIKDDKFKKLVKSVKEFPQMLEARPIVANADGMILGGNYRYQAAKAAGLESVPVTTVDFTPEQEREFVIKDNTSGGEWDWQALADKWDTEKLEEWGLDLPNFVDSSDEDAFDDDGIEGKNQYGVIVMCATEEEQEHVFTRLTGEGYNCKIVVT